MSDKHLNNGYLWLLLTAFSAGGQFFGFFLRQLRLTDFGPIFQETKLSKTKLRVERTGKEPCNR